MLRHYCGRKRRDGGGSAARNAGWAVVRGLFASGPLMIMMMIGAGAVILLVPFARRTVVMRGRTFSVMPESHADSRAYSGKALDRNGQSEQRDGQHAEKGFAHSVRIVRQTF